MLFLMCIRKSPRTPFLKGELRFMLQFLARCICDLFLFEEVKSVFTFFALRAVCIIPPLERGSGGFDCLALRAVWPPPAMTALQMNFKQPQWQQRKRYWS